MLHAAGPVTLRTPPCLNGQDTLGGAAPCARAMENTQTYIAIISLWLRPSNPTPNNARRAREPSLLIGLPLRYRRSAASTLQDECAACEWTGGR